MIKLCHPKHWGKIQLRCNMVCQSNAGVSSQEINGRRFPHEGLPHYVSRVFLIDSLIVIFVSFCAVVLATSGITEVEWQDVNSIKPA